MQIACRRGWRSYNARKVRYKTQNTVFCKEENLTCTSIEAITSKVFAFFVQLFGISTHFYMILSIFAHILCANFPCPKFCQWHFVSFFYLWQTEGHPRLDRLARMSKSQPKAHHRIRYGLGRQGITLLNNRWSNSSNSCLMCSFWRSEILRIII